eukprot:CAMPEP_0195018752 /NCGR_PEP_ID=MMETSP0326_2-20130528/31087_1 /TAXON_ID=2866 ORGANISM="Crypthecodinium cohnii, Strain Seligo" /NCGR_SAMPLE_ID=MMETSP0326_2 /ASSEMBLY_ACC=CAM_ASM_000348 /LENGTH=98 /DNA_ID=CAMNT_0040036399 /DNA_START=97 /DNA_END=391 /DNA_ORIENTATION=+
MGEEWWMGRHEHDVANKSLGRRAHVVWLAWSTQSRRHAAEVTNIQPWPSAETDSLGRTGVVEGLKDNKGPMLPDWHHATLDEAGARKSEDAREKRGGE